MVSHLAGRLPLNDEPHFQSTNIPPDGELALRGAMVILAQPNPMLGTAKTTWWAIEPPQVYGAGTFPLPPRVDMTSAHDSERWHRQNETVAKIPLAGVVCLSTTGGPIRVRQVFHNHGQLTTQRTFGKAAPIAFTSRSSAAT
jgi:hypothetical protein